MEVLKMENEKKNDEIGVDYMLPSTKARIVTSLIRVANNGYKKHKYNKENEVKYTPPKSYESDDSSLDVAIGIFIAIIILFLLALAN